jgi:hypothetical protein
MRFTIRDFFGAMIEAALRALCSFACLACLLGDPFGLQPGNAGRGRNHLQRSQSKLLKGKRCSRQRASC